MNNRIEIKEAGKNSSASASAYRCAGVSQKDAARQRITQQTHKKIGAGDRADFLVLTPLLLAIDGDGVAHELRRTGSKHVEILGEALVGKIHLSEAC